MIKRYLIAFEAGFRCLREEGRLDEVTRIESVGTGWEDGLSEDDDTDAKEDRDEPASDEMSANVELYESSNILVAIGMEHAWDS